MVKFVRFIRLCSRQEVHFPESTFARNPEGFNQVEILEIRVKHSPVCPLPLSYLLGSHADRHCRLIEKMKTLLPIILALAAIGRCGATNNFKLPPFKVRTDTTSLVCRARYRTKLGWLFCLVTIQRYDTTKGN